jgi:ATP-dependent Clp protease adaptor protein ClpS
VTTHPGSSPVQSPVRDEEALRSLLPLYAVVLHNDDVNSMDFVVQVLLTSVPSLTEPEAVKIMLEAHNEGKAVVIVCVYEQAEMYRDRVRSYGIACTVEKA